VSNFSTKLQVLFIKYEIFEFKICNFYFVLYIILNLCSIFVNVIYLQGIPKRQLDDTRITRNLRMSGPPVSDRSAIFLFLQVLQVVDVTVNLLNRTV